MVSTSKAKVAASIAACKYMTKNYNKKMIQINESVDRRGNSKGKYWPNDEENNKVSSKSDDKKEGNRSGEPSKTFQG